MQNVKKTNEVYKYLPHFLGFGCCIYLQPHRTTEICKQQRGVDNAQKGADYGVPGHRPGKRDVVLPQMRARTHLSEGKL